jgi:hypothetical protein
MKFDFEYQCDREWDEMKGGDRRRFCDSCHKHVHHISGMTKEEALEFLEENDWNVCVDFYLDDDGHTLFREAQKKLRLQNDGLKQLLASAAAVIPLVLAAAFIDFDGASTAAAVTTERAPIDLDHATPVISTVEPAGARPSTPSTPDPVEEETFDISPVAEVPPTPQPIVEEVEPIVENIPETEPAPPEPPPVIKERPRLRGKIARPVDRDEGEIHIIPFD